ncbi:MAG TPA: hypothetical protein VNI77_08690 [Nitrososphaera sp.]|nr:hypothetical protein [Nitrososphaera sp.]
MERQHTIFIAVTAAAFGALVVLGFFFKPLQRIEGDDDSTSGVNSNNDVIKVRKGQTAHVRYSPTVVKMIQDLPENNEVEVRVSSELQLVNFAGLNGELRYRDMTIKWVENGIQETISETDFKTIEYRFLPDRGNSTSYVYEDVDYIAKATNAQLVVSVKPLSTAKVGDRYTVSLLMHTGSAVSYAIGDKTIEIVP